MTHQNQTNELNAAVLLLAENGFVGMADAMQILIDEAMKLERNEYLRASPINAPKIVDRFDRISGHVKP
jgi:hypothetical protein